MKNLPRCASKLPVWVRPYRLGFKMPYLLPKQDEVGYLLQYLVAHQSKINITLRVTYFNSMASLLRVKKIPYSNSIFFSHHRNILHLILELLVPVLHFGRNASFDCDHNSLSPLFICIDFCVRILF